MTDEAHFDVAIIGGGINGASAAQHLSAAGCRVLVVEKDDFASGATSRSSRLLHCGLRHLANGDRLRDLLRHPLRLMRALATVREDMLARDELVATLPEQVKAMKFCLPIYKDDPYPAWLLDLAFAALRLASPRGVPLEYRRYRPSEMQKIPIYPWLRTPEKLRGLVVFREYIFDWPERIALDALLDARRMGADIRNYTQVTALHREGNQWQLNLRKSDGEQAKVTAQTVLNFSGAWVDAVHQFTGDPVGKICQGIKGIHIAIQLPEAFADHGVFTYNSLGEPLYCLPWRGIHYVGLTRTPFSGDASDIAASDQEIDWILAETNRVMPNLNLGRSDVVYSWAGVNPLTHDPQEALGSREIKIHDMASHGMEGMFALTGGAIMTHRRVARRVVQKIRSKIQPSRPPQDMQFGAGQGKVDAECAQSLTDVLSRRRGLAWDADQGRDSARGIAEKLAPDFGWDAQRIEAELMDYEGYLQTARRKPTRD
ncbi:FAD-dependent oxidoreductase [Falsihalocynthiibacter arcticus]|uniref:FAD dependent oxidoreductase domain-containing protein n=1 Tax=Falsihalocynthiibacter arcticus TaxID=1579316 RepID=A0A126V1H4_9RHOB|nr:FAD-dependent oxidoreductase [Falsihalocynthiibacter arcticus]AML52143.1 hypothetical protein RC74_13435 [Falsihalocynthiibacter arcticus]